MLYEAAGWVNEVRVSPDGRLVAFVDHPQRGDNNGNAQGRRCERQGARHGAFHQPRGGLVAARGRGLVGRARASGRRRFPASPGSSGTLPGRSLEDIGRDGRVLFRMNSSRREIVGFSAGDKEERNLTWLNWSFPIDLTADGKTVLFDEQNIEPVGRLPAQARRLARRPDRRRRRLRLLARRALGARPARDNGSGELTLLPTGAGRGEGRSRRAASTSSPRRGFRTGAGS